MSALPYKTFRPLLGIFDVFAQQLCSNRREAVAEIHTPDGGDQNEALLGACYGDIEPPLASGPGQWPKVVAEDAVLVFPVANAQDDHIALIPLHALQILNEEVRAILVERSV